MLNVVAVMFLNLTLSSFLHKCRSTAFTQVHLQNIWSKYKEQCTDFESGVYSNPWNRLETLLRPPREPLNHPWTWKRYWKYVFSNIGKRISDECVSNLPNKMMRPFGSPGNWYCPRTMESPLTSRVNLKITVLMQQGLLCGLQSGQHPQRTRSHQQSQCSLACYTKFSTRRTAKST